MKPFGCPVKIFELKFRVGFLAWDTAGLLAAHSCLFIQNVPIIFFLTNINNVVV